MSSSSSSSSFLKKCGKRASMHVLSKEELIEMVKQRVDASELPKYRRMTKEALCQFLGIPWSVQKNAHHKVVPITTQKTCTPRRSKQYPHRFNRNELIEMIREKRPSFSRSALMKMSFAGLCRLAGKPFVSLLKKTTAKLVTMGGQSVKGPLQTLDIAGHALQKQPYNPQKQDCRTRGVKQLQRHQRQVVDWLRHHRGLIAVHAVGSGKTLTAVVASQCYLDQHPTHKVVVVTPASLVANFEKELDEFGIGLQHRSRYLVLSYEKFLTDAVKKKNQPYHCKNTMLIIDEGHNLRTIPHVAQKKGGGTKESGKKTKAILQCADFADRVLILTATPVVNHPIDLLPLLNMIRDDPTPGNLLLSKNKKQFDQIWHTPDFWKTYMKQKFHFFTPETDTRREFYPHVEYHDIYIPMSASYLEEYEKVEMGELSEYNVNVFGESALKPFFNGIRRGVNTLDVKSTESGKSPKIQWIQRFLQDQSPQFPKTVIFSQFLDMGSKAILKRIPPEWLARSAFIDGSVPRKRRAEIVRQYNDNQLSLLFISRAGGEGLDLKGTKNIIIMESTWNSSAEKQAIGRAVRYRSHIDLPFPERQVNVYRLFLVKPRHQPHIAEILQQKSLFSPENHLISADMMLKVYQLKKDEINHVFVHKLQKDAIIPSR